MALITRGNRPPRQDEPPLSDGVWELIQQCWVMEPPKRPGMRDVAEQIMAISQCLSEENKKQRRKKKKKKKKKDSQCVSPPTSAQNDGMLQSVESLESYTSYASLYWSMPSTTVRRTKGAPSTVLY